MEKPNVFVKFKKYWNSNAGREARNGFFFISPWLIGFIAFQAIPLILVFYFSFTRYNILTSPIWVGLDNYTSIFTKDKLFPQALINTLYIVGFSVPVRLILAFFIALLLNQKIKARGIFRAIYYLPMIVPIAATAFLFRWMFQPRYGIINYFLNILGLPAITWLASTTFSKPSIIIVTLWRLGEAIVLFLAGLQGIPQEFYEAAEIDGASSFKKMMKITIPILTPTILLNLILEIIQIFQSFVWSYSMTEGGPLNSTLTFVLYIYRRAFEHFKMGYASALSVILFLLIMGMSLLIFKTSDKWVFSEVD